MERRWIVLSTLLLVAVAGVVLGTHQQPEAKAVPSFNDSLSQTETVQRAMVRTDLTGRSERIRIVFDNASEEGDLVWHRIARYNASSVEYTMSQPYRDKLPPEPNIAVYGDGGKIWIKSSRGGEWRKPVSAAIHDIHRYRPGNLTNRSIRLVSRNDTHVTYSVSGQDAAGLLYIRGVLHGCCATKPSQVTIDTRTGRLDRMTINAGTRSEVTIWYSRYENTTVREPPGV